MLFVDSFATVAPIPSSARRRLATCALRHVGCFDAAASFVVVVLLGGAEIAAVRVDLPREHLAPCDAVATALPIKAVLSFVAARARHDVDEAATQGDGNG